MSSKSRVTVQDVANAAGVPLADVVKVTFGQSGVPEHVRSHVLHVMKDLDFPFIPTKAPQSARFMGIAIPGRLQGDYINQVMQGIIDGARTAGYSAVISVQSPAKRDSMVQLLADRACAGFVLVVPEHHHDVLGLCLEYRRPLVMVDYPVGDKPEGVPTVVLTNRRAMQAAVQHLIDLGHQ